MLIYQPLQLYFEDLHVTPNVIVSRHFLLKNGGWNGSELLSYATSAPES